MDIYGIIGYPIKHSLSPAMHNAAFKELGIDAEYKLFEVKPEELEDFLLNRKDVIGFNITIPHKVRALEILKKRYPFTATGKMVEEDLYYVKLSGAINTVKKIGDTIEYRNTDSHGFLKSLEVDLKFEPKNKSILLIGCGGAGRAVIAGLSWKNIGVKKIYIYDLNDEAIVLGKLHFSSLPQWESYLENKIEFILKGQIENRIKNCHLLVNASSLGMKEGDISPIDKKLLRKDLFVYDVVYNRETQLIKDANEIGCKAVGGKGMLLYQGVGAFEFWTGKKAPVEVMKKALSKALDR